MAKVSPSWMGLLAAELVCCSWVFVKLHVSELRWCMQIKALTLSGLLLRTGLKSKDEQEGPPQMAFQPV